MAAAGLGADGGGEEIVFSGCIIMHARRNTASRLGNSRTHVYEFGLRNHLRDSARFGLQR